jgi:hypothetical protein
MVDGRPRRATKIRPRQRRGLGWRHWNGALVCWLFPARFLLTPYPGLGRVVSGATHVSRVFRISNSSSASVTGVQPR